MRFRKKRNELSPEAVYDSHVRLKRRVETLEAQLRGVQGRLKHLERKPGGPER